MFTRLKPVAQLPGGYPRFGAVDVGKDKVYATIIEVRENNVVYLVAWGERILNR